MKKRSRSHVREVQDVVCRHSGITRQALLSRARPWELAWPRMLAGAIARHLGLSDTELGPMFHRSREWVGYAHEVVQDELMISAHARRDLDEITQALHARGIAWAATS